MGFLNKLFPKKAKERDQIIAELRQSINRMGLRSRKFEANAVKHRQKAKKYMKTNKALAKQYIARYNKALKTQKRYDSFISKLEDRIFALEQAEDINDLGKAMETATRELNRARSLITPQRAMEIMAQSEHAMEDIDRVGEIFAEEDGDFELDEEAEAEFEALEAEMLMEDMEGLPEIPDEPVTTHKAKTSKQKKELEELKRSIDID
ncbi:MAG: Snf7 family protein [Candidatus Helarchaeota archaeon]